MAKKTISQLPVAESMGENDVLLMETPLATKCITKDALLQDVNTTLASKADAEHTHAIADVTDLQAALDGKANTANLKAVATSGSYNDLTDKPNIPEAYELPQASADTLGGIKVGEGLTINNESGVLSLNSHIHNIGDVKDLQTKLDEKIDITIFDKADNILNKDEIIIGKTIQTGTGNIITATDYGVTNFIEIDNSLEYYYYKKTSVTIKVCFYDANKQYISDESIKNLLTDNKINIPESSNYIRVSIYKPDISFYNFTITTVSDINNVKWDDKLKTKYLNENYISNIKSNNIADNIIDHNHIKLDSIYPKHSSFFIHGNNLIDVTKYTNNKTINSSGDVITSTSYMLSDKIELSTDNSYYLQSINKSFYAIIHFFNESNTFISSLNTNGGLIELPENTNYCRISLLTSNNINIYKYVYLTNGITLNKETLDSSFYDYNAIKTELNKTWYYGKKVVAYGDSITEQATWFQPLLKKFKFSEIVNCGVGGTTVANNGATKTDDNITTNTWMCSDDRINTIPSDANVILIFGGHNDWATESITIGEVGNSPFDDTTYIGAYSIMIKKLITNFPNAKLIAMTPVGGRTSLNENQDTQMELYDRCMTDIADATKKVCAYFGIPCIDVNGESGINTLNHTTYITDLIHPNAAGGKLIANVVASGLKRFEPLE